MEIPGCTNRVLEIDLTRGKYETVQIEESDRKMYLGGKGLAMKLLYDRLMPGTEPLGKDNILVFMTGVLSGTSAPCSGRFSAVTKSPLTGIIASSSCGGPFGNALKSTGWDGVVIKGKARTPQYIIIDSRGAVFKSAGKLWGSDTGKAQEILNREGDASLVIGPAGENGVSFANMCSGTRFLGRGGMGAVMGSKNLKGITVKAGDYKVRPANNSAFEKARWRANKYINANAMTSRMYRNYGTGANMNFTNAAGILPVRNFTGGKDTRSIRISGEAIAEKYKVRHLTCRPCSILCGHRGTFSGVEVPVPEYETTALMGANLDIYDPEIISEWNEICSSEGMDTISAGNTIGWAMEAAERGLMKSKLRFGSPVGISAMLMDMARKKGIGKELSMGTRWLSEKYGGSSFAMHVKGLEMAGYDPRGSWGQGLSYAVANRGACHLSSSLFVMEVFLNMAEARSVRGKARAVRFFENLYSSINSLHICQFTAFAFMLEPPLVKYTPLPLLKAMVKYLTGPALKLMDVSLWPEFWASVTGIKLSVSEFMEAGERTHVLERYMNTREGITRNDDTLPDRLLSESRDCDPGGGGVPLDRMIDEYYTLRGYDDSGIPGDAILRKLGIEKH